MIKHITLLLVLFSYSPHIKCNVSKTYTAAVVEYYRFPITNATADDVLEEHTGYYKDIISNIKQEAENIDIIVFPESTLYGGGGNSELSFATFVPLNETLRCHKLYFDNDDSVYETAPKKFLHELACASKENSVYTVVNVIEKEDCTTGATCTNGGYHLYNTNVVFDRKGTIISKYRKYNLFNEHSLNKTAQAEVVTFDTDFGVTFGMFTCFDIMFDQPTLELVRNGTKHFIFPSMWFSELPFLVSTQAQEMWAITNDVTLLASGANNPAVGNGGTGIYQGRLGRIDAFITDANDNFYIIAAVQKDWNTDPLRERSKYNYERPINSDMDNFLLTWDNLTEYDSVLLDYTEPHEQSFNVCTNVSNTLPPKLRDSDDQFCCSFNYNLTIDKNLLGREEKDYYFYRMVAFSGIRSFTGAWNGGIETCSILACINATHITACGRRFKDSANVVWPVIFNKLSVTASFEIDEKKIQFPNSLENSNLQMILTNQTTWLTEKDLDANIITHSYEIIVPQERVLTFGIYGRNFRKDSDPRTGDGTLQASVTSTVLLCIMCVFCLLGTF